MFLGAIAFSSTYFPCAAKSRLAILLRQVRRNKATIRPHKVVQDVEDIIEPSMTQFGSKRRRFFERNRTVRLKQQPQVATATWMKTVIAQGTDFEILDSKVYFREEDVNWSLLRQCDKTRQFNPIGMAVYYDICVQQGNYNLVKKAAAWKFGVNSDCYVCDSQYLITNRI